MILINDGRRLEREAAASSFLPCVGLAYLWTPESLELHRLFCYQIPERLVVSTRESIAHLSLGRDTNYREDTGSCTVIGIDVKKNVEIKIKNVKLPCDQYSPKRSLILNFHQKNK